MTATQEFVVPKSIPITSLPAGFELEEKQESDYLRQINNTNIATVLILNPCFGNIT